MPKQPPIRMRTIRREFDPDHDSPQDDVEGFFTPRETVSVIFSDEFAPSQASVATHDPSALESPNSRFCFYNDHLLEVCGEMFEMAVSLGCPSFPLLEPLYVTRISEADYKSAMSKLSQRIEYFDEGSPLWLCLQVYMHRISAAYYATVQAPSAIIAETMMKAGACAREYELSIRNREHAARGRKTIRAASLAGRTNSQARARTREAILSLMDGLIGRGQSKANASRLAYTKGLGTSPEANLQLYKRHRKR